MQLSGTETRQAARSVERRVTAADGCIGDDDAAVTAALNAVGRVIGEQRVRHGQTDQIKIIEDRNADVTVSYRGVIDASEGT